MNQRATLLAVIVAMTICGCSVVKGAPKTTSVAVTELSDWKNRALVDTTSEAYSKVQPRVNVWIESKAKEVEIAGGSMFTQVDITRDPSLVTEVDGLLGKQRTNLLPAEVIKALEDVLKWLMNQYSASRTAEAASTSTALREFKWPAPQKPR